MKIEIKLIKQDNNEIRDLKIHLSAKDLCEVEKIMNKIEEMLKPNSLKDKQ